MKLGSLIQQSFNVTLALIKREGNKKIMYCGSVMLLLNKEQAQKKRKQVILHNQDNKTLLEHSARHYCHWIDREVATI